MHMARRRGCHHADSEREEGGESRRRKGKGRTRTEAGTAPLVAQSAVRPVLLCRPSPRPLLPLLLRLQAGVLALEVL